MFYCNCLQQEPVKCTDFKMSKNSEAVPRKRYRKEEKNEESDDSDYVPYVPLKERRKQQMARLGRVNQIKEDEDKQSKGKLSSDNEMDNGDEDGQV